MAFDGGVRELPGSYPAELVWAQLWIWRFPLPAPPEHSGLLWRFAPGHEVGAFLHPPAATREALYLGTASGAAVALKPDDGSLLWAVQAGAPVAASPLVAGDLLIVAHEDGALRAINRFTQEEVWEISLGSPVVAPPSFAAGKCTRTPRTANCTSSSKRRERMPMVAKFRSNEMLRAVAVVFPRRRVSRRSGGDGCRTDPRGAADTGADRGTPYHISGSEVLGFIVMCVAAGALLGACIGGCVAGIVGGLRRWFRRSYPASAATGTASCHSLWSIQQWAT